MSLSMSMSMSMSMQLESDYPSLPPRDIGEKTLAPSPFDTADSSASDNVPTSVPESINENSEQIVDSDSEETVQLTSSPSIDSLPNEIEGDIERGGDENHSKLIAGGTTLVVLVGLSLIALFGMLAIRRRSNASGTNILGANESASSVALSSLAGSNF